MSFLELFDVLNERLVEQGREPVAFDHDCREGICGSCSMMINGRPHGPELGTATCQLHMRKFADGDAHHGRAVARGRVPGASRTSASTARAFDRIIEAGGYITAPTGTAPDANLHARSPRTSPTWRWTPPPASAAAPASPRARTAPRSCSPRRRSQHLNLLPQGQPERWERTVRMVDEMERWFGSCTNHGECEAACPKEISIDFIALLNRDYVKAQFKQRRLAARPDRAGAASSDRVQIFETDHGGSRNNTASMRCFDPVCDRVDRRCVSLPSSTTSSPESTTATSPTTSPSSAKADPTGSASASSPSTAMSTRSATRDQQFTIQSISKPFVYGMALEDRGGRRTCSSASASSRPATRSTPSPSTSVTDRPFNPMVNAGAIVDHRTRRRRRRRRAVEPHRSTASRRYAGRHSSSTRPCTAPSARPATATARSRTSCATSACSTATSTRSLDLYFRQCSLLVTCRDLAVDGGDARQRRASIRSRGERALARAQRRARAQRHEQTAACTTTPASGSTTSGSPAKSGVSGGVIAVLPGQLGIGVFSPPLDARGNSVRGIEVCTRISRRLRAAHPRALPAEAGRRCVVDTTRADVRSTGCRPTADASTPRRGTPTRIVVFELQGDLFFASAEPCAPRRGRGYGPAPTAWCSTSDGSQRSTAQHYGSCGPRVELEQVGTSVLLGPTVTVRPHPRAPRRRRLGPLLRHHRRCARVVRGGAVERRTHGHARCSHRRSAAAPEGRSDRRRNRRRARAPAAEPG